MKVFPKSMPAKIVRCVELLLFCIFYKVRDEFNLYENIFKNHTEVNNKTNEEILTAFEEKAFYRLENVNELWLKQQMCEYKELLSVK